LKHRSEEHTSELQRDLHSFPTRRSPELSTEMIAKQINAAKINITHREN